MTPGRHLRISLDMLQFQQPMTISLQSMAILSVILLALTLSLSLRLGRQLTTPLLQLRIWLRDPDDPAPGAGRQDEIGDLARQLQSRLVPEKPTSARAVEEEDDPYLEQDPALPELEDESGPSTSGRRERDFDDWDEDAPAWSAAAAQEQTPSFDDWDAEEAPGIEEFAQPPAMAQQTAVLAIQLGAQEQLRRLPRARLLDLLQRYRDCLTQAAALYQGSLHTLSDGSSLMLFNQQSSGDDYLTHALCCGELLRALSHALQIEVADSGITLQLQLGLTRGEGLSELGQGDLLLSETAQDALALSQHSRNLLLLRREIGDDPLVRQRARVRSIASPEGACCVERLLEPYPSLLERQLARMHEAS